MLKVYDYLVYIRDIQEFRQICKSIDNVLCYKHQYKFNCSPTGSVTEVYTFEEEKELFKTNHWNRHAKSVLSCIAIYEEQKAGMEYLIEKAEQFKNIYSFVDDDVAEELRRKYPKMNDYKDKWSWGSDLFEYYDAGYDVDNPRVREIDCDLLTLECNNCYEEFTVCGREDEIEGEKLQCPHCKVELQVGVEWEPVFSTFILD